MSDSKLVFDNDRTYDILKKLASTGLPALATFWAAFSEIWNLAYGIEVVGTITAFNALLGAFVGVSRRAYDNSDAGMDGSFEVHDTEEGGKQLVLALDDGPETLLERDQITFKVSKDF